MRGPFGLGRFDHPVELDPLPKQDPLVGRMQAVHPYVLEIGMVRDRPVAEVLRARIDEREIRVGPASFCFAPQHLVLRHGGPGQEGRNRAKAALQRPVKACVKDLFTGAVRKVVGIWCGAFSG
jgi:hypothetical protein